jgi:hypothetical protein
VRNEEENLGRKVLAEDRFAAHLRYLRSVCRGDTILIQFKICEVNWVNKYSVD